MIEKLKNIDVDFFIFLNGKHTPFIDTVMYWVGHRFFWVPLYLVLLWLVATNFKRQSWVILFFVALLIIISDQISVHFFKNIFLRYRPCHNIEISQMVHTLYGHCGGKYGFVSSHAVNTAALATFLSFLFHGKYKYFSLLLFLWVVLIAYQRVYAGVHYPADVAIGALAGIAVGVLVFKAYYYTSQYRKT